MPDRRPRRGQQLTGQSDLNERQREHLQLIETSGQTLLALLNDVLDLSRIGSGRLQLESVHVDLSILVREVVDVFRQRAGDKGLRLEMEIRAGCSRSWAIRCACAN